MNIPEPQIVRSRRRSMSIEVTREGKIVVKAPLLAPKFIINQFIKEKEGWMQKAYASVIARQPQKKLYKDGEPFLFLGIEYPLKLVDGIQIGIKEGTLQLPKVAHFRAEKELTQWYIRQAKEVITKRVMFHAEKMKASYVSLHFSDTKSKWGTCFPDNSLQFNWRLVMTPLMVLDYVVIHELVHTTEKNHGDDFWRKVRQYTPAYNQHRKWLNEHAHLLQV